MIKSQSTWPHYSEDEVEVVSKILRSGKVNYWTGEECRLFEKEFSKFCNSKYSVAVSNGTVALDLALLSLGVGSGDEVIVTSRTFIASASSIVNVGAKPIFCDVDLNNGNISIDNIKKLFSTKTKAIICVHLGGFPCDMEPIMNFAVSKKIFVIEDCSQAHGAKYKEKPVGSIGHIGCWSFCQDKIISTGGEGGMVTTNSESLWQKMWSYKDHGKDYKSSHQPVSSNIYRYIHESFGTNWRMTEMQAVIGQIQLKRMNFWHTERLKNATKIWGAAKECKALRVPIIPNHIEHAAYKCYVFVETSLLKLNWTRERLIEEIKKLGVPCYSGSCSEVYLENSFNDTEFQPKVRLENAKKLGEESLMFLVHPTLSNDEIQKTCEAILRVMKMASK